MTDQTILSIHSRVGDGSVGNTLIEAAFARIAPAARLLTVDTVQWTEPGNAPRRAGFMTTGGDFTGMLSAQLARRPSMIIVGYLPTEELAQRTASKLESLADETVIILDPIMGDEGRLYIQESAATAIRELLLPLATYAAPNITEASFLATGDPHYRHELNKTADAILAKAPRMKGLAVTGVPFQEQLAVMAWEGKESDSTIQTSPALPGLYHGTGDLLTGVVAACLSQGQLFSHALSSGFLHTHRALKLLATGECGSLREGFLLDRGL